MTNQTKSEFASAFELAKEALAMVGRFQTPPTPKVFEVWYRYAEGKDESIREQLGHRIDQDGSIDAALLEQIYDQYCVAADDVSDRIGRQLSNQMAEVGSLIRSQLDAGEEFSSSISSANDSLSENSESTDDIKACIASLLQSNQQMESQLQSAQARLSESQEQIDSLRKDLDASQEKVMTDPLTGVGNRRFFDRMMNQSITAPAEQRASSFLLLIDLDEFKDINDTFGHSVGDEVLKYVAAAVQQIRTDASIARYGGDEFAVFLSGFDVEQATLLGDEIRKVCVNNRLKIAHSGEELGRIGVSIGVARLRENDDGDAWFNRADQLLYKAKQSGRNCVMVERSSV